MLSLYPTNKWAWRLKYPFISSKFLLLLFLVHASVFGFLWIFLTSLLSSTEELLFKLIMGWIAGPIAPSSLQGKWEKAQITQFADEELIPTENWFSVIVCILQKENKRGWMGLRLYTAIMVYHQTAKHSLSAKSWSVSWTGSLDLLEKARPNPGEGTPQGPGWLEQSTGLPSPAATLAKNKSKEEKTAARNSWCKHYPSLRTTSP